MISVDQKINAVMVSRDDRLLSVLLESTSSNTDGPKIDIESDIIGLTSKPIADVYVYDLDVVDDDVNSAIEVISNFKKIIAGKPLILIGKQATLNKVLGFETIKEVVARTINKPLSLGQLNLAINACSTRKLKRTPTKKTSMLPRRFAVLGLTTTALLLVGFTFFASEKTPFKESSKSSGVVTPSTVNVSQNTMSISSVSQQIKTLNDLAKTAINDNRLFTPESNNALYYLKQIELHDSYNTSAHQTRNELLILLKGSYENRTYNSNSRQAKETLSAIVELEPYNQKYVFLLSSIEQLYENSTNSNSDDLNTTTIQPEIEKPVVNIQASTDKIKQNTKENIEANSIDIVSEPIEVDVEFVVEEKQEPLEQELLMASTNSASMPDMTLEQPKVQIESAKILKRIEPKYPKMAVDLNHEGWVELEYQVDAQGRAINIKTVEGERIKTFEKSAFKAIKQWEFSPSKNVATNVAIMSEIMTAKFDFMLGQ